ncbi:unnamed protein product [Psylliodes chrysocephalus]|uniref:Juvenile hormone binding protein n=1 Tax=Psylliodes chrysocephalus TaxID=3402493 RepID=A0A9P0G7Z9_9CUCU|nr:unnamed protein product [Psylliodes chrysocephala]
MWGVKFIGILALAFVVCATDLEEGLAIMACASRAMKVGVPSLGIPTYNPLKLKDIIFESDDYPLVFKFEFDNITWAGLPNWNLSAIQKSKDSDSDAVFDYELYWKHIEFGAKVYNESVVSEIFKIELEDTTWKGDFKVTKPNEHSNGTINKVGVRWETKNITASYTTSDDEEVKIFPEEFIKIIQDKIESDNLRNYIGDQIYESLEDVWWNTGKVWDLVQWCEDNPDNSAVY